MNAPSATARAEHKLLQLRKAERLGFAVPATRATNCPETARSFANGRPAVAKTLVGGRLSIDGTDYAIFTTSIVHDDMGSDDAIQASPVILQSRIQTRLDLRVTVVRDQVFAAGIALLDRTEKDVDWRRADPARIRYERYALPTELEASCAALVAEMCLAYGALDLIVTPEGEHVFLELNPAGQWGWIERALGFPITDSILDALIQGTP